MLSGELESTLFSYLLPSHPTVALTSHTTIILTFARIFFNLPPSMSSMYHVDRHTFTVIFEPTGGFQRNYTFSSKFIYFSVIEVGSLFKLPKRYTDPEPRTEYVVLDDCYYTAVVTFHISGAL